MKLQYISVVWAVALLWLSGCASVPEPLRAAPEQSPDPTVVRSAPGEYAGITVRWGGVIVAVENGATYSEAEVVARPLDKTSRPLETDSSTGRFLVRISGFIDPMDYAAGREITVVGVLEGAEQRDIGAYSYSYPVVRATAYYLWSPRPLYDPYFYSPFYDPFYHPWYPYGPYYRY